MDAPSFFFVFPLTCFFCLDSKAQALLLHFVGLQVLGYYVFGQSSGLATVSLFPLYMIFFFVGA